jgi:hypothetical protein
MPGTSEGFFEDLVRNDRKLELDYEFACTDAPASARRVREVAAIFLEGYAAFNGITRDAAIASYATTIRRYATDIRAFIKTGRYPLELNPQQAPLARTDYDLFLILTILATRHRCAIMEEISRFPADGAALVIGVGSGIELSFIGAPHGGDAYDLYINAYARQAFPHWRFHEELYRPGASRYRMIYAIELLEHLPDPYAFLADCHASLEPGGRLVATIAVNVPQFDHTMNFPSDDDFEARAAAVGLPVEHKRVIPHAYARTEIGARNVFYVFRRAA